MHCVFILLYLFLKYREATLANAKRVISQVATTLRLPHYFVDRSFRLYQLALQHNFLFGRRQAHIVATCLYIICRQEKSPYLLIDFADALQCNVYMLGKRVNVLDYVFVSISSTLCYSIMFPNCTTVP